MIDVESVWQALKAQQQHKKQIAHAQRQPLTIRQGQRTQPEQHVVGDPLCALDDRSSAKREQAAKQLATGVHDLAADTISTIVIPKILDRLCATEVACTDPSARSPASVSEEEVVEYLRLLRALPLDCFCEGGPITVAAADSIQEQLLCAIIHCLRHSSPLVVQDAVRLWCTLANPAGSTTSHCEPSAQAVTIGNDAAMEIQLTSLATSLAACLTRQDNLLLQQLLELLAMAAVHRQALVRACALQGIHAVVQLLVVPTSVIEHSQLKRAFTDLATDSRTDIAQQFLEYTHVWLQTDRLPAALLLPFCFLQPFKDAGYKEPTPASDAPIGCDTQHVGQCSRWKSVFATKAVEHSDLLLDTMMAGLAEWRGQSRLLAARQLEGFLTVAAVDLPMGQVAKTVAILCRHIGDADAAIATCLLRCCKQLGGNGSATIWAPALAPFITDASLTPSARLDGMTVLTATMNATTMVEKQRTGFCVDGEFTTICNTVIKTLQCEPIMAGVTEGCASHMKTLMAFIVCAVKLLSAEPSAPLSQEASPLLQRVIGEAHDVATTIHLQLVTEGSVEDIMPQANWEDIHWALLSVMGGDCSAKLNAERLTSLQAALQDADKWHENHARFLRVKDILLVDHSNSASQLQQILALTVLVFVNVAFRPLQGPFDANRDPQRGPIGNPSLTLECLQLFDTLLAGHARILTEETFVMVVSKWFNPLLQWRPGKTCAVIRLATLHVLHNICREVARLAAGFQQQFRTLVASTPLLSLLMTACEDDYLHETRVAAIRCIASITQALDTLPDASDLPVSSVLAALLRCLDDDSREVRLTALNAMQVMLAVTKDEPSSQAWRDALQYDADEKRRPGDCKSPTCSSFAAIFASHAENDDEELQQAALKLQDVALCMGL